MTQDIYTKTTERIIELMEQHGADWVRPWACSATGRLRNGVSDHKYRGINCILLGLSGYGMPLWASYKQWGSKGGQVRKGERATHVLFYKPLILTERETGKEKTVPLLRSFPVFNIAQVEGIEVPNVAEPINEAFSVDAVAEKFIADTGAQVHNGGDRACYIPALDIVRLPEKSSFTGSPSSTAEEAYYSTAFHELIHWSGHKNRLDRNLSAARFGQSVYAFEELVAELGAAYACQSLGVTVEPRADHALYLNNWLAVLRNDKKAIFTAAALAEKAFGFLSGFGQEEAEALAEAA